MKKFALGVIAGAVGTLAGCTAITLRRLHNNGTTLDEWANASKDYLAGPSQRGNTRRETVTKG